MSETTYTGVVKMFDERKGYGFIRPESADGDIFVPMSSFKDMPEGANVEGKEVNFEKGEDHGKTIAKNVQLK